jgi:hypothetical protein
VGQNGGRLDVLARQSPAPTPAVARAGTLSLDDMWRQALILSKSGLVPKALKDNPEGIMLVGMRGAELGWSFTTALDFIDVFEGRAVVNAQGGLAVIRKAGHRARFVHEECDATKAVIIGQRRGPDGWEPEERITWTIEEAETAGLLDEWVEQYTKKSANDKWDTKEKFLLRREGNGYVPKKFGATTMPDWVKKAIADGQVKHKDYWWNYPSDQLKARAAARLRRNVFSDVMAAYGVDDYTAEEMGATSAVTDIDETAEHDQDDDVVDGEIVEQGEDPGLRPEQMAPAAKGNAAVAVSAPTQAVGSAPGPSGDAQSANPGPSAATTSSPRERDNGGAAVVGASTAPLPRLATGGVDWRDACKRHSVSQGDLLRQAQEFARGRALPVPETLAEIADEQLVADMVDWLGPA